MKRDFLHITDFTTDEIWQVLESATEIIIEISRCCEWVPNSEAMRSEILRSRRPFLWQLFHDL